jgi:hypothetical protein
MFARVLTVTIGRFGKAGALGALACFRATGSWGNGWRVGIVARTEGESATVSPAPVEVREVSRHAKIATTAMTTAITETAPARVIQFDDLFVEGSSTMNLSCRGVVELPKRSAIPLRLSGACL